MPDRALTPGAVDPFVTLGELCSSGYTSGARHDGTQVRDVSSYKRKIVFAEYRVDRHASHFEVDHLVSLELGGNNDVANLWPQSYDTQPYNAHVKDRLENRLHWLVCHKNLDLGVAQQAIATDWVAAYKLYVGK